MQEGHNVQDYDEANRKKACVEGRFACPKCIVLQPNLRFPHAIRDLPGKLCSLSWPFAIGNSIWPFAPEGCDFCARGIAKLTWSQRKLKRLFAKLPSSIATCGRKSRAWTQNSVKSTPSEVRRNTMFEAWGWAQIPMYSQSDLSSPTVAVITPWNSSSNHMICRCAPQVCHGKNSFSWQISFLKRCAGCQLQCCRLQVCHDKVACNLSWAKSAQ